MNGQGRGFSGDRLLAIAFVLMVTVALAGITTSETGASFTGTSLNPTSQTSTLTVAPPASQSAPVPAAAGVVNLSWTATPTAPGAGHTLAYVVLRGPVGGPYAKIATTAGLAYSDTPPSDGTYAYVIAAQVAGGGTFTSANSAARSALSDRTAPVMSIACNGAACGAGWYAAAVAVTVSGVDAGSGMGSVTRNVDAAGQLSTAGASAAFSVSGDGGHTVAYFGTDALGNAASSATQAIRIDGAAPTAASGISGTGGQQNGEIDLSWTTGTDALSGVASQTIRGSAAGTGACPAVSPANYPTASSVAAVASTFTVTGLAQSARYCFYIVTTDNAGNSTSSAASARIAAN